MPSYRVDLDEAVRDAIAEPVFEGYREVSEFYAHVRTRQRIIRHLVKGEWGQVFADELDDGELPMIANTFKTHTEDIGHLFGQVAPTERVPVSSHVSEERDRQRERVLVGMTERSRFNDGLEYHGMAMAAAGYTAIKVWPEKGKRDADRFPTYIRLDPLNVYPAIDWQPDRPTEYAWVTQATSFRELERQYPDEAARLRAKVGMAKGRGRTMSLTPGTTPGSIGYDLNKLIEEMHKNETLMVVDYYSKNAVIRCAVSDSGEHDPCYELLLYKPVEFGLCPVQIAARPTWSDEPLGLLDDTRGIALGRNRFWRMLLDYFVEMVYGGRLVWNVRNPGDRGPRQNFFALSPDAYIKPIQPEAPNFMAVQMIGQLEAEERSGSVSPASRQGEVPNSKATAAFIGQSQGEYQDVIRSLHRNYAAAKRSANEVALAMDEKWCNAKGKKIIGIARGRGFAMTYEPAETIDGEYGNTVTFGPGSGVDRATQAVMDQNRVALGILSRESAIERDPDNAEYAEELARLRSEQVETLVLSEMLAAPDTPLDAKIKALVAIQKGEPTVEVAAVIMAARNAAQAALPAVAPAGGPFPAEGAPNPTAPPGVPGAEGTQVVLPPAELLRAQPGGR